MATRLALIKDNTIRLTNVIASVLCDPAEDAAFSVEEAHALVETKAFSGEDEGDDDTEGDDEKMEMLDDVMTDVIQLIHSRKAKLLERQNRRESAFKSALDASEVRRERQQATRDVAQHQRQTVIANARAAAAILSPTSAPPSAQNDEKCANAKANSNSNSSVTQHEEDDDEEWIRPPRSTTNVANLKKQPRERTVQCPHCDAISLFELGDICPECDEAVDPCAPL